MQDQGAKTSRTVDDGLTLRIWTLKNLPIVNNSAMRKLAVPKSAFPNSAVPNSFN